MAKLLDREGIRIMQINGIEVEDTFAEAFEMTGTRIIITAAEPLWARRAAEAMTGFATSVIGCGVEAGIERFLESDPSALSAGDG